MDLKSKTIFVTGVVIYTVLALLAYIYYQERTIFADVSFHLFYIIKDCKLAIQANRFGAIFTQLFPLVSEKLGLPLKQIMINYSEAFVVCNAIIFFLCFWLNREKAFAAVMMLFSIFMVTDTFYWIQSELLQGIALTILFFALITRYQSLDELSAISLSILMLLLFTLVFIHPLLIVIFIFVALFLLIDHRFIASRKLLWAALIIALIMLEIKNKLMLIPWYDQQASKAFDNIYTLFPHYFDLPSNFTFLKEVQTKFYLVPIALLTIIVFYFSQRKFLKLLLCLSFFIGHLALINITIYNGAQSYYMESFYLPLSIFLIVPLMFDVFPTISPRVVAVLLSAIVIARIFSIQQAHFKYTAHVDWEKNFLLQTSALPQKKLMVNEKELPPDPLNTRWASPYEFWLLSSLQSRETRSVIITDSPENFNWALIKNKSFITTFGVFDYSELPSKYFVLKDTSQYVMYRP